jgi:hypothetical protein
MIGPLLGLASDHVEAEVSQDQVLQGAASRGERMVSVDASRTHGYLPKDRIA